jgi:hypothetical protein
MFELSILTVVFVLLTLAAAAVLLGAVVLALVDDH